MKLLGSVLALGLISALLIADTNVRKAPELAFTLSGQGYKLLIQYRGKVVAIEFILTTCSHCQEASKVMTRLQQEYGPRGLQAIDLAINALDENRTPDQASQMTGAFANNFQVGYPVGFIGRDPMMSFLGFSIMDRMVVPQLVMIDRKGTIRYQTTAGSSEEYGKMMNESTMRQHIEELLAQPVTTAAGRRAPSKKAI